MAFFRTTANYNPDAEGQAPQKIGAGRFGLYVFLVIMALFFLMPLYVMIVTSLKPMSEITFGNLFALPKEITLAAWQKAWSSACTGLTCDGLKVGFWNSVRILIPSTLLSLAIGAITGYAMSFWRPKGANLLLTGLVLGAFIPYQVFLYPLVLMMSRVGLYNNILGVALIHTVFGLPIVTLLFRNFYASFPMDLFKAARVDGGKFWSIFLRLILPMSTPIITVAAILQITGIWNDYILGVTFAGTENFPMTVQLNNIVNTSFGEKEYNVNMAATMLAALLPLVLYLVSGRWFVRGISAGAVKG